MKLTVYQRSSLLLIMLLALFNVSLFAAENLLINGNFNQDNDKNGWPDGWRRPKRGNRETDGSNSWLLFEKTKSTSGGIVTNQKVALQPTWQQLTLTAKMRVTNVIQGEKIYHNARVMLTFNNKSGKQVGGWPKVFSLTGTSDGWQTFEHTYQIPDGAATATVGFGLWGTGKAECDDLTLSVTATGKMATKQAQKATLPTFSLDPQTGKQVPPKGNLIQNGSFDKLVNNWPASWPGKAKVWKLGKSGENIWFIADNSDGKRTSIYGNIQSIRLNSRWTKLCLQGKLKVTDVKLGTKIWHNARLTLTFHDSSGKQLGGWPKPIQAIGTSDWQSFSETYSIPVGASEARVGFGLWSTGKAEFDDISLHVTEITGSTSDADLPKGVKAEWDMNKAYKKSTPLRENYCINGLWKWRPAKTVGNTVPEADTGWGYYKVPGPWPGVQHWLGLDSQTAIQANGWNKKYNFPKNTMAWYQRQIKVPATWAERKVNLLINYLNSYAKVFIDGRQAGEIFFPGGKLDITRFIKPGKPQTLSIFTAAIPLNSDIYDYSAADHKAKRKASVLFKGICGDVYLTSGPKQAEIADIKIDPSVRNKQLNLDIEIANLATAKTYHISGLVTKNGKTALTIPAQNIKANQLGGKRFQFSIPWANPEYWDLHQPENKYDLQLNLADSSGNLIDTTVPLTFGFRELWQDGRDFYLNDSRIHFFALPIDSARISAGLASYDRVVETLKRYKAMGVNLVYTHNHNCLPGTHISFEDLFKAADDVGMLVVLSTPHVKDYSWGSKNAINDNGYAHHLEWYVRQVQNHPSVAMYAMNHNYAGYKADQDPVRLGTDYRPDSDFIKAGGKASKDRRALTRKSTELLKRFDTSRPFYNHSSGNTKEMATLNCYLDFVPSQERSEWFQHWAQHGNMPLFLVEYGDPIYANFTFFRGSYKGIHTTFFRINMLNQYFYPEWGSSFRGDKAYDMTDIEKQRLRFENKQWLANRPFRSYDYPEHRTGKKVSDNEIDVRAKYLYDNLPAFRTLGVSAYNIWEDNRGWNLKSGVNTKRRELKTDWSNLQKPGFSADFEVPLRLMAYGFDRDDWQINARGKAMVRGNNRRLVWLAGKPGKFTDKDHNFLAGETISKQVIAVNDARTPFTCDYTWLLNTMPPFKGQGTLTVTPGNVEKAAITIKLPQSIKTGSYQLTLKANLSNGEKQSDKLSIEIMPNAAKPVIKSAIALFDPLGETAKELSRMGIPFSQITADSDLKTFNICIIGKKAITLNNKLPEFSAVRQGLKLIVFEQAADVLEKRFGFRVQEHGLRNGFARIPNHPLLTNISTANLHNWRGDATLISPRVNPYKDPGHYPLTRWCGYQATRPWRSGCYGNIASVLIRKPNRGNFLPIIDGGFSMQYSPLMVYQEGQGCIIFCQMDVIGRTASSPAATQLVTNILQFAENYHAPTSLATVLYAGEKAGLVHLTAAGIKAQTYNGGTLANAKLLILGPGSAQVIRDNKKAIAFFLQNDGKLVAVGLSAKEIADLPTTVKVVKQEYISSVLPSYSADSVLAGISSADVHNRAPKAVALLKKDDSQPSPLALDKANNIIFLQLAPWQFDYKKYYNVKPSFSRTSFALNRILGNLNVAMKTPLLERFGQAATLQQEGEHLDDYMQALWLETKDGKTHLLPTIWKGLAITKSTPIPADWQQLQFDDQNWRDIRVPGPWEDQFDDLTNHDGYFLYRLKFNLPEEFTGQDLTINLGRLDDEDHTYINGKLVGQTNRKTNPKDYYAAERSYTIPASILKAGDNVITIKVFDVWQKGGIFGYKETRPNRLDEISTNLGSKMRWLNGLYLTLPEPLDDPYRYFRW